MANVGVVLISHSKLLVMGLENVLKQVMPNVSIAMAGGIENGELGTDAFAIKDAIESVHSSDGVVILFDLGSALINAELAIEMLADCQNVKIADAPFVEGAYAAVIEAGCGSSLEDVLFAATETRNIRKIP